MTVGEVTNTPDAGRPKAREIESKKQTPWPKEGSKGPERSDRVEISGETRTLFPSEMREAPSSDHYSLGVESDKLLARLIGELDSEDEEVQERLEAVRMRLREAYYERPEVLQETARRLIEAIFGR